MVADLGDALSREEGNRTSVVEPEQQETTYAYDELGKLLRVVQPGNRVTSYQYDQNRNRVLQTDANGHEVRMTYDELDRMDALVQDPAGFAFRTSHAYDANGNETVLTDPKGQTVTSTYDELNRLKTKAYAYPASDPVRPWRQTTSIAYVYDANGNLTRIEDSVASGTDPPSAALVTTREYDDLDRLLSETSPLPDGGSRTVAYTYFANGTRKTVTGPSGETSSYTYDGQNRLATATVVATGDTTRYAYFPDDLLRSVTYPSGVTATHAYDKADRLTSLANTRATTTVSSFTYGYDRNGNRLSQIEVNGGPAETTGYTYDALNRLATVTYPVDANYPAGRVVTYALDDAGNRTRETERTTAGAVLADKQGVFDNLNRLTTLTDLVDGSKTTTFTWDANGNQRTKTVGAVTTEYRYDCRDKMVEVVEGSSTPGRFQYDFEGRRSKKIGSDGVVQYVYDQTSVLAEFDGSVSPIAKYEYGSERLLSMARSGEGRRWYSLDGLRSVVNLTDDSGSTVASYHLDAWGNFRFPTELTASGNRFAFTGYEWDPELGLFNAKARYFDPQIGRFTSQDSFLGQIDNPPSLHRYFYANDNPTRYIDPTGHDAVAFWQAVSQGHGWDYTEGQLKQSAAAAGQATKEWLGDAGMSISVGAARAMSMRIDAETGEISMFSPGHHPTPEYLAGVPQPQNRTEWIGAELTDLVITAAPVLVPATRQPRVSGRPSIGPGELSAAGPANPKVVVESAVPPAAAVDAPVAADPVPTTTGPPPPPGGSLPARPTNSLRYSTIFEAKLREGTLTASDANHFRQGNRQLHELFEADQALAQRMEQQFPGIVEHVKPGPRGGVADTPPPGTTWHHQPTQEGTLQLVPRSHHRSSGPVQETLHPEGRGGREQWGGGRGKTREVVKEQEVVNTGGGS